MPSPLLPVAHPPFFFSAPLCNGGGPLQKVSVDVVSRNTVNSSLSDKNVDTAAAATTSAAAADSSSDDESNGPASASAPAANKPQPSSRVSSFMGNTPVDTESMYAQVGFEEGGGGRGVSEPAFASVGGVAVQEQGSTCITVFGLSPPPPLKLPCCT